jgi:flagellar hook-associated protein 1 FlgK
MSFGLNGALGIATGGLRNVSFGLSVVSQNVANASTPQYAVESATQTSLSENGQEFGVQSGLVVSASSPALQGEVATQNAEASAANTTSAGLATIEPALGTVAGSNDLGSQLTAVQSAFSALLSDPSNGVQQDAVVTSAATLARGINTLSAAYGSARQAAESGVVSGVGQLNTALAQIGTLNKQIVTQQAQGLSTADTMNQRAQAENTISTLVNARFLAQPDGSVMVLTAGGAQLPTDGSQTLTVVSASVGPTTSYPGGGIPGILLGGTDITAQLTGGSIGANVVLRDVTLPTYQGSLDEFSQTLSARFAGQGLALFSDGSGNVPVSTGLSPQNGYVGYAGTIQVNPAVQATPSLVRDGTQAVAGSATGPSAFTPNPSGLAGFSTLISRVLTYALGSQAQAGVAQVPVSTSNLGPGGNLQAGYAAQNDLLSAVNTMSAAQAADSGNATSAATDAAGVQTSLQGKLTSATGVDMDTELGQMVVLQNAYGANAKVISTIEALFADVLAMVTA